MSAAPAPTRRAPPDAPGRLSRGPARQLLPHDLDAERSLLGAVLLSRVALVAALQELSGGAAFYRSAHGLIFDAAAAVHATGSGVDPITVADELDRRGHLDAAGGRVALVELQAEPAGVAHAADHARVVSDLARRRP